MVGGELCYGYMPLHKMKSFKTVPYAEGKLNNSAVIWDFTEDLLIISYNTI